MTEEEIQFIGDKVKAGTATPEEELALLKFLNQGVEEIQAFIKEIMATDKPVIE